MPETTPDVVKFRGAREKKPGKFVAEIVDPNTHRNIWLGTFVSAIDAAKAYDKAAFEIRGDKANLNFPLDYGLSPNPSTKTQTPTVIHSHRKRRKDVSETVAVPLDANKVTPPLDYGISPEDLTKSETSTVLRSGRKIRNDLRQTVERKHKAVDSGSIDANKLNSPLEYGISPDELKAATKTDETDTVVRGSRKRRKHARETVVVVEEKHSGDDSCQVDADKVNIPPDCEISPDAAPKTDTEGKLKCLIDAIKLHDSSGRSSVSPPRQSPAPMGTGYENGKKDCFKWTDEYLVAMCDILIKHIEKNGRNSPFKWDDHQLEFEKITRQVKTSKALRSKYQAMKRRYKLWQSFMNSEKGLLRWDETTGKLDYSNAWWDNKIKENPKFKKIQSRQPSRVLQEAWDLLFGKGVDCAAPANQLPHVKKIMKTNTKSKPWPSPKCNGKDSERAAVFVSQERRAKPSGVNTVGNSSIGAAIDVINRMVEEGLMASYSELWCFGVSLCEDDVKREVFMSLGDDVGRLAWLQYKQNLGK